MLTFQHLHTLGYTAYPDTFYTIHTHPNSPTKLFQKPEHPSIHPIRYNIRFTITHTYLLTHSHKLTHCFLPSNTQTHMLAISHTLIHIQIHTLSHRLTQ